ncbi:hypothetical protein KEM52_003427, partial [Ascosphaera acerosa]
MAALLSLAVASSAMTPGLLLPATSGGANISLAPRAPLYDDRPADCPPCFNCQLDKFQI